MRCLICVSVLLVLTASASADEKGPVRLTPKEIADGWILLFDGETAFGWNIDGDAKVENGVLVLGGTKKTTATPTTKFRDCEMRIESNGPGRLVLEMSNSLSALSLGQEEGVMHLKLEADQEGATGSSVHNAVINRSRQDFAKLVYPAGTRPTLRIETSATLNLRNVKIRPSGLKSIFNGKDLSGWKEFPGRKSKFTVTPEGWLNVKDGNGDLATEGQWANFVLQLDCISNGKHLNSGIFFRCLPNQYQMGYEAQVRNEFTPELRDYTVEEYDPNTNELKEKKKVQSPAVDFGTGAIYRRQPARRQTSKDGEWFTMTVVADGRHLATWVNGIQVTDWTDHRPLKENARVGCYLEKGPISIQGHDPTTDLSFRNFRIADWGSN